MTLRDFLREYAQNPSMVDFGRDTAVWNRAKLLGVIDTLYVLGVKFGNIDFILDHLTIEEFLTRLNQDRTADKITIIQ